MLEIWPISVLGDNYVWILQVPHTTGVLVVDPGSGPPVAAELATSGLEPTAILLTHHHSDHVGGVATLLEGRTIPVHGPARESITLVDRPVRGGDRLDFSELNLVLDVVDVPGHTAGHVAYVGNGFVLCGDTLFAGGCGRLFEGTPAQMVESLDRLSALPPETSVYCAHEYTEANLRFGAEVEPGNRDLTNRREHVRKLRASGRATVPSTIEQELQTNPFLRCTEPTVVQAAERYAERSMNDRVDVFATVRAWKDGWRG